MLRGITVCIVVFCIISTTIVHAQDRRPTPKSVEISYSYDDKTWAFYDIPSKARAYSDNGVLIAEANVLGSEKIKIGQSITEFTVEETHYEMGGTRKVRYKGRLVFSWPSKSRPATPEDLFTPRGYARVVSQQTISGSKQYDIFVNWPMGE